MKNLTLLALLICLIACKEKQTDNKDLPISEEKRTTVEVVTTKGTMIIELYNETPLHRNNFVKLANEKAFDSLLFHRVIENFMVQAGDPDSRNAIASDTLGEGDLPYMVNAEINTEFFHKKGALGAARDGNLARASSAMQFYIVQGKANNDSLLTVNENRINDWLGQHHFKNDSVNKSIVDALLKAEKGENFEEYIAINDSINALAKAYTNYEKYTIPEAHRKVYKTLGGTPHLDQNYTVFGEVIKGLEVIDVIAASETNSFDRPIEDVRIISVSVVEN